MVDNSLELIDRDLASRVSRSSPKMQRDIAYAVARFALEWNSLNESICMRALDALQGGQNVDEGLRNELLAKVEALDEVQWDLHEAADEGRASKDDYITAFRRARAANAVYSALNSDAFAAASDSIYEANAATRQLDALRLIVLQSLEASHPK